MSNLRENNLHNIRLMINKDEYWDFFVDKDRYGRYSFGSGLYDGCLISYIDVCKDECVSGDTWLFSTKDYAWDDATSIDNTLYNISYTGIDNGLFRFRKDRISNKDFWDLYQNNSFRLDGNDLRLKLHSVSGNTLQYEYPLHVEDCQIKLNGGFYQGFFETECDKYQILPNKMIGNTPWEFEFQLKKCDLEPESKKTLNDKYPNNKGIFFYIGTRSENKWVYLYHPEEDDCFTLSPDDYVEDSHIDKNDYIIGNFYDPEPDFEGVFGDNDKQYHQKDSDDEIPDIGDFTDFQNNPKHIDENLPSFEETTKQKENMTFYRGCYSCNCGKYDNAEQKDVTKSESYLGKNSSLISNLDCLGNDADYFQPEMNITDFDYQTTNGISFKDANKGLLFTTDNKFLLFNRTCTGYTTNNWIEGTQIEVYGKKKKFRDNLFILMNRTCTGYTVDNIDQLRDKVNDEYDYKDFYGDLYNNALAFRITDDGEIGYRLLTIDCNKEGDDKTAIEEGYSFPNVIKDCEWQTIHIKIIPALETMKMYFYVDGKLVYITKELPKLNLRPLNEEYVKQEGVPYNISLGGGTQGLAETILPNYMLNPTRVFPLEEYFAGSFIGYMKSFKFYDCGLEYGNILSNYKFEKKNNRD